MFLVFFLAGSIWLIGRQVKMPLQARWLLIGLLYVAVLGIHTVLPEGTLLREATGGSVASWLMLGGGVALVLVYREVLQRLRARVAPPPPAQGGP